MRALAGGRDPGQTRIGSICSRERTMVSPDAGVGHAMHREKAVCRLLVEADGQAVGMLTIGNIAVERESRSVVADISAAPLNP